MSNEIVCPGCGLKQPDLNLAPHEGYNASGECWELKGELTAYKQVQIAHMNLVKPSTGWPPLVPPPQIDEVTVLDVLNAEPGDQRDDMIKVWAKAVWKSWSSQHDVIRTMCAPFIDNDRFRSLFAKT